MFVFLSKFLPPFVYPLGLACILLILALVFNKRRKWHITVVVLALIVLWLGGNKWLATLLSRGLEWQYIPAGEIQPAEAIVVLGGGTEPADYPRPIVQINTAGDRVLYGAYLYKQGKAPIILVSGGSISWMGDRTSTPAQEMATIMDMMEVPSSAILEQGESFNTYEDAEYSAKMLRERGISRIILVTSAMHMPRSVGLFEKQGFEVIPAPTDFRVTESSWNAMWEPNLLNQLVNFLPSSSALNTTSTALKEYIGLFVYRLRGWL